MASVMTVNKKYSSSEPLCDQETLSHVALTYLTQGGEVVSYPNNHFLVRRGEPGRAFYVIVSGVVEVVLNSHSARRITLAQLGAGSSFGEMSLVSGEPVSADIITKGPTTIIEYPAELFTIALAECEELRNHILTRLSSSIRQTNKQVWNYFQRTETYNALINTVDSPGPIVAESPAMRKLENELKKLDETNQVILIRGESGTGKLFIARKIHEHIDNNQNPFISLDCRDLPRGKAASLIFGSSNLYDFTIHDGEVSNPNLLDRGTLHLSDGGTLVLRNFESLDFDCLQQLTSYTDALESKQDIYPSVRIILTTSKDIKILAEKGTLPETLNERICKTVLDVPNLNGRRRDILQLASIFLDKYNQNRSDGQTLQFDSSAEHVLLSARYNHKNVAELAEAVELAATFADDSTITAEHIFTGPKEKDQPVEYDLGDTFIYRWISKGPWLKRSKIITISFFALIAFTCLLTNGTVATVANGMIWGLWWPSLTVLFLIVGRLWCTVCPISTGGQLIRKVVDLNRAPPPQLKKYTGWIMAFMFFIIVWAESVFGMTHNPFATGIFLLTLLVGSAVFCAVYQREVWCRFVCPLGALAAGYSVSAAVRVHATQAICSSQCKTHNCVKGSDVEPGCPVYHHPLYVRDSHCCKLCGSCLRSCPHGSARPYLRVPLQDVWRVDEISPTLAPFAFLVFFLALVMLASHWSPWIASPWGFTFLGSLSFVLAAFLNFTVPRMLSQKADIGADLISRVALSLLILGWGPFMALHIE